MRFIGNLLALSRYAGIQDEDSECMSKHFEQITHWSMNEMNDF